MVAGTKVLAPSGFTYCMAPPRSASRRAAQTGRSSGPIATGNSRAEHRTTNRETAGRGLPRGLSVRRWKSPITRVRASEGRDLTSDRRQGASFGLFQLYFDLCRELAGRGCSASEPHRCTHLGGQRGKRNRSEYPNLTVTERPCPFGRPYPGWREN